jgi:hypothetical protein
MNYICYDKKNCPKWTKRINKSVTGRMLVRSLHSGTLTVPHNTTCNGDTGAIGTALHVVYSYNKQLNSPWQYSIMPWWQTSAHPLVPQSAQGCITRPAAKLNSQGYKTYIVPGQGWGTYGTDRDLSWHLSFKFSLFNGFKVQSWLCAPPAVNIKSSAFCHLLYLRIYVIPTTNTNIPNRINRLEFITKTG